MSRDEMIRALQRADVLAQIRDETLGDDDEIDLDEIPDDRIYDDDGGLGAVIVPLTDDGD